MFIIDRVCISFYSSPWFVDYKNYYYSMHTNRFSSLLVLIIDFWPTFLNLVFILNFCWTTSQPKRNHDLHGVITYKELQTTLSSTSARNLVKERKTTAEKYTKLSTVYTYRFHFPPLRYDSVVVKDFGVPSTEAAAVEVAGRTLLSLHWACLLSGRLRPPFFSRA